MIALLLIPLMLGVQVATPSPEGRDLAPLVVRSLVDYGQTMAARFAAGPILLDSASLRQASRQVGEAYSTQKVVAAASRASKESRSSEAISCKHVSSKGMRGCEVAEDGLFIAIDSVRTNAGGAEVFATLSWTDRRPSGATAVGFQTLRLTFARTNGTWKQISRKIEGRT